MAFCETSKSQAPGTPGAVGDFGWKLITSDDPVVKERKLASELANGRLAMVAIMGMFFQEVGSTEPAMEKMLQISSGNNLFQFDVKSDSA
jgi:hypothetical protein